MLKPPQSRVVNREIHRQVTETMKSYFSPKTLAFLSSLSPDQLVGHYGMLEGLAPGLVDQLTQEIKFTDLNATANLLSEGGELSREAFGQIRAAARQLSFVDQFLMESRNEALAIQNLLKGGESLSKRIVDLAVDQAPDLANNEFSKGLKALEAESRLTHCADCHCSGCQIQLPSVMAEILEDYRKTGSEKPTVPDVQTWADERFAGLPSRAIVRDDARGDGRMTIAIVPTELPDELVDEILSRTEGDDVPGGFNDDGFTDFLDLLFGGLRH